MKKRFIAAALCLVAIFGMATMPMAAATPFEEKIVPLRWTNTQSITLSMSYANGKVTWTGQIVGNANTQKIVATYKLEKRASDGLWTLVNTWPGLSTTGNILISSGSSVTPKGTYRLTVTGTVASKSGYAEPISDSLIKTFN